MYSRMAGTGLCSASRGSQSRAARRRPSDMEIQASSMLRTRSETSWMIGPESISAPGLRGLPQGGRFRFLSPRLGQRKPAREIIAAEAPRAGGLDPLGIEGIGPPEAVDEGRQAEEDVFRQRLG